MLNRAGEIAREFYVVLRGSLAGYTDYGSETERLISVICRGRFWGGTNLLTGQPAYLTTVAPEDGEVIVLKPAGCVRRRRRALCLDQARGLRGGRGRHGRADDPPAPPLCGRLRTAHGQAALRESCFPTPTRPGAP